MSLPVYEDGREMTRVKPPVKNKVRQFASNAAKDVTMFGIYPRAYRQEARKPIDPRKVLFIEGKLGPMPDAFEQIWKRLEEDPRFDPQYISLGLNEVPLPQYIVNCRNMVRELATAHYAFLCDASNIVSCVPLRTATKVVQLWHACGAFKKWGMSTGDKYFGATGSEIERHPYYKNLDLVTVSAPEVAWAYREAMMLEDTPEIVQPLGVSRTDVFFDKEYLAEAKERVRRELPEIAGRKIILYAPTFRGRVLEATSPDDLDVAAMKRQLGDDYALLVKHHPYVKHPTPIPPGCEDFAFTVDMPIDQLLIAADVCISDYSSLVFEYSLFERPMAFFAPDIRDYDDWRGFYYDYEELTPGPIFEQTEPLIAWIRGLDEGFDATEVAAFRDKFMSACDGHATDRILRWIGIDS